MAGFVLIRDKSNVAHLPKWRRTDSGTRLQAAVQRKSRPRLLTSLRLLQPPIPPLWHSRLSSCFNLDTSGPPPPFFCTAAPPPFVHFCRPPPVSRPVLRLLIYLHNPSDARPEDSAPFSLLLHRSNPSGLSLITIRGPEGSTVPGQ